jgi:hypothetical protein
MREQLDCGLPPRLILEIDICERLSVVISHNKAGGLFLDRPRWRETAGRHAARQGGSRLLRSMQRV